MINSIDAKVEVLYTFMQGLSITILVFCRLKEKSSN